MSVTPLTTSDSFRQLMADRRLVQAGAWIAGELHTRPQEPLRVPSDPRGAPDPTTDVPYPDWPFGSNLNEGRSAVERFVSAGLIEPVGNNDFRPTDWGQVMFPILPLFYVRDCERIEERFPQIREAVKGKRVLDAGCGLAPYAVWLDELAPVEVIGVDYLQKHLDIAAQVVAAFGALRTRLILGPVEQIPLPDASVDFVFCRGVVSLAHKHRTMSEFSRLLAPGGQGLLMLHAPSFYWRMVGMLGPSKLKVRRFLAGLRGLAGGAAFELLGSEILWKREPAIRLAYERHKSFSRLAESCGLRVVSWEHGIPKPFVWIAKD